MSASAPDPIAPSPAFTSWDGVLWAVLLLHPISLAALPVLGSQHVGWAVVLHLDALLTVVVGLLLTRRASPRPDLEPRAPEGASSWTPTLDGFTAELVVPTGFPEDRADRREERFTWSGSTMLIFAALVKPVPLPDGFYEGWLFVVVTTSAVAFLYTFVLHVLADWDWTRPRAFLGHTTQVELAGEVLRVGDQTVVLGDTPVLQIDPVYDVLHVTGSGGGQARVPGDPAQLLWLRDRLMDAARSRDSSTADGVPEALSRMRGDDAGTR